MPRSRNLFKIGAVSALIMLWAGVLIVVAQAQDETRTLDVMPEVAEVPTGTVVTLVATLSGPAVERTFIHAEMEPYPSGPGGTAVATTESTHDEQDGGTAADPTGDTPDDPDAECTIAVGESRCAISYEGTQAGSDQWRFWVDDGEGRGDFNGDGDEARNEGANPTSAGQGDQCNEPVGDDSPPFGEPDCTDVVRVNWEDDSEGSTLDCDDSSGSSRERETNAGGESEQYTCRLRGANGSSNVEGVIYGEVQNGVNDPDLDEGQATYNVPDFVCATVNRGESTTDVPNCTFTVSQSENEIGTAQICFWSFPPGEEDPAADDLCGDEETDERVATTTSAETPNDMADKVELTWSSAGTGGTTTTATTSSSTTSGSTTTTTSASTTSQSTTTSQSSTTDPTPDDRTVASNVTIDYSRGVFSGSVGSSVKRCQKGRRVTVKRHKRGPNQTIGVDRSNRAGNWKLRQRARKGRYYAVAAAKVFTTGDGTRVTCKRDRSPTQRVR